MAYTVRDREKVDHPIDAAPLELLKWWEGKIADKLEEDPHNQYAAQDTKKLAAIREELELRANGGAQAPAAPRPTESASRQPQHQSAALATRQPDSVLFGNLASAADVTARLSEASQRYHLVSPATSCGVLPEGCSVSISVVNVDPNPDPYHGPKDVYSVGGRLGLSMTTLQRIASAAALSWVPERCGRLDDGRDPHYCHYRAVGEVRNFDGSLRTVTGEVEIDARDGSPQIEEIITKARNSKKGPRDPASQILELRKFILRHAESKAKNRAIADMGVKRSYDPSELQKPFAVARLMWTGETSDPELRREAFRLRAEAMGGATRALYGPQARPALPVFQGHSAPPVGSVTDDAGDIGTQDFDADDAGRY